MTVTPLSTPRLTLRPLREDDAAPLSAYRSEPLVARYQGWGATYSLAQAHDLIAFMRGRQPGGPGWYQFAIAERATDGLVGDLGLRSYGVRHAELGFTLASRVQGRGYGREAVRAALDLAFGALDCHRSVAATDPRNGPANRLLDALGFRLEGLNLECSFDGAAWLDEHHYALLKREWQAQPARRADPNPRP